MKKASKLFWVLLAVLPLVIGCGGGKDDKDDYTPTTGYTQYLDWTIVPGWQNNIDATRLKVQSVAEGTNGVLKVTWGASSDQWIACDLSAMLPADIDYSNYDGISFRLKTPIGSNQFNFQLTAPYEDGTGVFLCTNGHEWVGNTDTWVTITRAFTNYEWRTWSGDGYTGTLGELLANTGAKIYISPQLNTDNTALIDQDIVIYLDNIGFYKTTPTNVTVIWDFND